MPDPQTIIHLAWDTYDQIKRSRAGSEGSTFRAYSPAVIRPTCVVIT